MFFRVVILKLIMDILYFKIDIWNLEIDYFKPL